MTKAAKMIAIRSKQENVVQLHPENDIICKDIISFLESKGLHSENTRIAYETDIRQFFQAIRNKEMKHITKEDLLFRHAEITSYQKSLTEKYENSTVNRKMASIKQLFEFLARDYAEIRTQVFDVDRLKEHTNSYGVLTLEEAFQMIEKVKEQRRGEEKSLFIEMAVRTSIRVTALLDLTWENITPHKHYYLVNVIDKGQKEDEKPIPVDFYERLQVLKKRAKFNDNNRLFNFNKKTPNSIIDQLVELIPELHGRNITFHSLKKVAINFVLETTGNFQLAAQQGNHSNIQTTHKHYSKKREFEAMPGLTIDGSLDMSQLEGKSAEELMDIIKNLSVGAKAELINKAKENE